MFSVGVPWKAVFENASQFGSEIVHKNTNLATKERADQSAMDSAK